MFAINDRTAYVDSCSALCLFIMKGFENFFLICYSHIVS